MAQATEKKKGTLWRRSAASRSAPQGDLSADVIVDHLPLGIFVIDVRKNGTFRCSKINKVFSAILRIDSRKTFNSLLDENAGFDSLGSLSENLRQCAATKRSIIFDWSRRFELDTIHLECHIVPIIGNGGRARQIVGTVSDRTMQWRAERQMRHDALYDNLTNLPNRKQFMDRLERASIGAMATPDRLYGLLLINVDRLKVVNESLGHLAGDELLISMARRLKTSVQQEEALACLGGDEFALLLDDMKGIEEASAIAATLHERMRVPFNLGTAELFVSLSIGIATRHGGQADIEGLMTDARIALSRAKSTGKAHTEVFSPDIQHRSKGLLQLETDLRRALARAEFELHYQPLVSLTDGTIAGFEALVRWHHPDRGMVPPNDFIPLAEETGLIVPLGTWVLREACRQHRAWLDSYPDNPRLTISVNVSGRQFRDQRLAADIREIMTETGIEGPNLKLEITESVVMENADLAADVIAELKTLGIGFAIDDFGTGYSSLSYLNRFPIDILKIDRSFVNEMHESEDGFKIVQILASLAATLNLTLVAEGIETERQLADLAELGCNIGQGFLFSRPLPAGEAGDLLRDSVILAPSLPKSPESPAAANKSRAKS